MFSFFALVLLYRLEALGLVGGVAVVLLLLWCAHLVYPDLFSELGWLSPARIQSTVLLRGLLAYFPI